MGKYRNAGVHFQYTVITKCKPKIVKRIKIRIQKLPYFMNLTNNAKVRTKEILFSLHWHLAASGKDGWEDCDKILCGQTRKQNYFSLFSSSKVEKEENTLCLISVNDVCCTKKT